MNLQDKIGAYIERERETLSKLSLSDIEKAVRLIQKVREAGGTVYTCGNGGSAATASHFVCDFSKGATENCGGKPFIFECLSDNTPIITAIANDICYEDVFVFQLRGKLKSSDALLAVSGSGNSENVLRAARYAKEMKVPIIGLTGYDGGKLHELADYPLHIPIHDMQITEDLHMMLDHLMLQMMTDKE